MVIIRTLVCFQQQTVGRALGSPFFASFDPETGRAGKPFLMPQKDPDFYDTFTKTYNLPEMIKQPVRNGNEMIEAIK